MNKQEKLKAINNLEKGICPACDSKDFWLEEDGREHESYKCKTCNIEVYVGMERVPDYAHMYNEETDTETVLFDNSD